MALDRDLLVVALPRYEIGEEIGRGGWGVVYAGRHLDLDRSVAIKQLPRAFGADPEVRDRFISEARIVASLEHPHVIPVYDFVELDGLYVLVMELADGGTLWDRFQTTGLETDEAIAVILAAAVGLHHAHERDLLHRDVKPENILYSGSGTVKVADFGIAKSMGETHAGRTATGSVLGTPAYMAPEQVTGAALSPATDVYALAVMCYELVTGRLPYPAVPDGVAQMFQHVHEDPIPIAEARPEVPAPVAAVVERALAKDPNDRPGSAEEFAWELATAATAAFGPGWLARTGVDVMGATSVVAVTERATGEQPERKAETSVIRPEHIERHRLGQLQAQSTAPPKATPAAAPDDQVPSEPESPPAAEPSSEPSKRGVLPIAIIALVVVAVVVVAIVALSGGGTDDPEIAETESTVLAITASEEETFRGVCEENGVSSARCECALERSIEQLEPAVLREGLSVMLESEGALTDELLEIFQSCIEDGF